jgi:hypothetical protein
VYTEATTSSTDVLGAGAPFTIWSSVGIVIVVRSAECELRCVRW